MSVTWIRILMGMCVISHWEIQYCTAYEQKVTKKSYRASQKTWYRPWFVHSLLFSIRKFKIQINILKENSFSSNIYFVSSKLIVYFWIYDLFSKNPWNSFFFPRMTILRIKSNSRLRVVVLNSLFLLECVHALFANQALFPINPTTKFF